MGTQGLFLTGLGRRKQKARKIIRRLVERGFVPAGRRDLPPVPFELPFNWRMDPYRDPNWRMQLHAWRMMDPMLAVYDRTSDVEALRFAVDIAHDWLRWVVSEPRDIGRAWYDMATGLRAGKLAYLRTAVQQAEFPGRDLAKLDDSIALHFDRLMRCENFNQGNHGIFQANGLRALAYAVPDESPFKESAAGMAADLLCHLVESQFTREGMHREGAPEYHFFAVSRFDELLSAPWWAEEEVGLLRDRLTAAKRVSHWLCLPNGQDVTLGDTVGRLRQSKDELLQAAGDADEVATFANGYNFARRLQTDDAHPWCLFFRTAYDRDTHCHRDLFSVLFWSGGSYVLEDPGKYGYKKDRARAYVTSRAAHNGVYVADEEPSELAPTENYLVASHSSGGVVSWHAVRREVGLRVERGVVLVPDTALLIWDRVVAGQNCTIGTNWTFGRHKRLSTPDGESSDFTLTEPQRPDVRVRYYDGCLEPRRFQVGSGRVYPSMRGWVAGEEYKTLWPAPCAFFESEGREYEGFALFELHGGDMVVEAEKVAGELKLAVRRRKQRLREIVILARGGEFGRTER